MLPPIHSRRRIHGTILVLLSLLVLPLSLWGQQSPPDSAELHERARRAQRDFESTHRTLLPRGADRTGERCDEYVGRLCLSAGDLGWEPAEEDPLVVSGREHLRRPFPGLLRPWIQSVPENGRTLTPFSNTQGVVG